LSAAGTAPPAPGRRHEVTAFIIIALMAIPVGLLAAAALLLPPGISVALVTRGFEERRPTWILLGALVAVVWLLMFAATARRVLRRPRDKAAPP
jgi:uncharacterized membrane protein YbhN (UPF0104 family)